MLPTFSPEGSGTRAGVACQLLVLRFPPKGWKQRGRRGACALRGEKPRAIASHGTGSGRPDDVAIPQPFSPPPPHRAERFARSGAGRHHWRGIFSRVGAAAACEPAPSARHSLPAPTAWFPCISHGVTVRLAAGYPDSHNAGTPYRVSPCKRRRGGHPIECPRMLRLLFPHPYRRRRRCGKTRRGGRLDHAIDLDESATRDIMRMQRRFGKTEHRGKADVGVFH